MDAPQWNAVVLRYDEIGLKGGNRSQFEKKLENNIRHLLHPSEIPIKIHRVRGRIWMTLPKGIPFPPETWETIRSVLPRAFGLASFSPVMMCTPDIDTVLPLAKTLTLHCLKQILQDNPGVSTFRLRARRADKRFPMESRDFERLIVDSLPKAELDVSRLKLDLINAQYTVGVEIREEFAFIWYDEYAGPGGLPVGSNENVLTLLSGGIDSPVAAWLMMKRGCHSDFITFDSHPYTPPESVEKVKVLVESLNRWQSGSTLWVCNIAEIQKQIRDLCQPRFRTVLYRRMMMRIASKIAFRKRHRALITGEAVGQVASQTVTNINTINSAASFVVIRPLAGADKLQTIALAEKIGTFDISKKQVPDSCTVFAPDSPATKATLWDIEREELKLPDITTMIDTVIETNTHIVC